MIIDMLETINLTNVTTASNGVTALDKLRTRKVNLIICDWNMPYMSGLEFYETAKKEWLIKDTPFLMVSAENEKEKVIEALKVGISDYMVKPISMEIFVEKVKDLLQIRDTEESL